jgi:hypothetical protein
MAPAARPRREIDMPDTVMAPAAGAVFATDLLAGAHWPYAKLAFGAENSAVPVADSDGTRLPVLATLASGQTIAVAGVIDTNGLTDGQLRASPIAVQIANQPVTVTGAVALFEPAAVTLASGISLAAGSASVVVTGMSAGSYIFEAVFAGSDLQLQRRGPDGLTWINAGVLAASGSVGVVLAAADVIRLRNNSNAAISGLFARVA